MSDALAGSWSVEIGGAWTAEWNNVTVQNGAVVGTGTIVHGGVETWNVAIGGRVNSDNHASIRMDLTPVSNPGLGNLNVFLDTSLASTSSLDGYAVADVLMVSGSMLNGLPFHATKH
jgi:hypothetical protein